MISWLRERIWVWTGLRGIVGALFTEWIQPPLQAPYPDLPQTVEDALEALPQDSDIIDEVLTRAHDLYAEGHTRSETIEGKAGMLLGAAGIATSLLTGSGGLLLGRPDSLQGSEILPFGTLLVLTLTAFLYAGYKAVRSLRVAPWAEPGPLALYESRSGDQLRLKRVWAAHLLVAKARNDNVNHMKAGWLGEAQAWFALGIFLLLPTAVSLVVTAA